MKVKKQYGQKVRINIKGSRAKQIKAARLFDIVRTITFKSQTASPIS